MFDLTHILLLVGAYIVGSIPTGFLVARAQGIADIRAHGSGNIGATNVARVLGLPYFFIIFFLDAFKAACSILFLKWYGIDQKLILVAATVLLLGNGCSIFLQFRGGKGMATLCGIFAVLHAQLLMAGAVVFFPVLWVVRRVGSASVVTLGTLPFIALVICQNNFCMCFFVFVSAILGIFWHRVNLVQLVTDLKIL